MAADPSPITARMSRDRRAGNVRTRSRVRALPTAAGITRKGITLAIATNANPGPVPYALP